MYQSQRCSEQIRLHCQPVRRDGCHRAPSLNLPYLHVVASRTLPPWRFLTPLSISECGQPRTMMVTNQLWFSSFLTNQLCTCKICQLNNVGGSAQRRTTNDPKLALFSPSAQIGYLLLENSAHLFENRIGNWSLEGKFEKCFRCFNPRKRPKSLGKQCAHLSEPHGMAN